MEAKLIQTAVVDFILPWFMRKKEEKAVKPSYVKGVAKEIGHELKENHEFDPVRTIIASAVAGLMMFATQSGYFNDEQANCVGDVLEDKIEEVIEKTNG